MPPAWWHGEEVERVAVLVGGKVGAVHVVAVALVDADAISVSTQCHA